MKTVEAGLNGAGMRVALVVCRDNPALADRLLAETVDCLAEHGVDRGDMTAIRVPSAFALPPAVKLAAANSAFEAVIGLGVLVMDGNGDGKVAASLVSKGLSAVAMAADTPIGFGLLAADNLENALAQFRAPGRNPGRSAAAAILEMFNLRQKSRGFLE